MTRTEAHNILDAAQRGELVTKAVITEALQATGDLARYESLPVKYQVTQWPVAYTSPQWTEPEKCPSGKCEYPPRDCFGSGCLMTRAPAFAHAAESKGGEA